MDNLFEAKRFDWDQYLLHRPDYTKSNFYDIIWEFHTGKYDLAYDVGCGPAQVAQYLQKKFKRVKASDVSPYHVEITRQKGLDVEVSKVEEVAGEPGDLITATECLPLMDVPKAVKNFKESLVSGGTLAAWFYGGPKYDDPEIQKLHPEITDRSLDQFRPFNEYFRRGSYVIDCWFDNVEFDNDWEVKRIKWNEGLKLSFIDDHGFGMKTVEPKEAEHRVNPDLWAREVDFDWAKGCIDAQIPRTKDYITEEVKEMYEELRRKMDGKKWKVTFPVVLVLARKK